jgi:integrase
LANRIKTNYPGVYYRETQRLGHKGIERVYYIVFKKNGKVFEEKVGRQFSDDMTPARAANIRGERVEGKHLSRKEIKAQLETQNKRITINKLWEEYKKHNPQLKGILVDENRFDNYIKPNFGNKEPRDLSPFDVDGLRVRLLKKRKPGTVKNILELLRRLIGYGVKKHLCPGINFTIEMPRVDNVVTEDLSPDRLKKLIKVIKKNSQMQAAQMMHLVLYTGMRRGELFRLKWDDIDFRTGYIRLRDPKGGRSESIPLSSQAEKILKSIEKTESSFVFPGKGGEQRTDIKRQVNKIKELAELPENFRALHGLRHVYASLLASSGKVDMYTLQKLLTHKSPNMTQRYAHLRNEALKNAAEVVDRSILQDTA